MKSIAVVGSINVDHVLKITVFPKLGETVIAEGYEIIEGGKGANQAASMGKLDLDVYMFGKIGNDVYGKYILKSLQKCNVNIENIITDKNSSTGSAFITVDEAGNNTIVVNPGANGNLSLEDIENFKRKILENDILVLQMEIPRDIVAFIINIAHRSNKIIILNLAPALDLENDILNKVDFLILNELELENIAKIDYSIKNLGLAIKKIREFYYNKLIITLGLDGAAYSISNNNFKVIPTFNVKAVDRTGAGDAFIGGFTSGIVARKNIEDCIVMGNAAGSYSVAALGAQSSLPYKSELESFMNLNKRNKARFDG